MRQAGIFGLSEQLKRCSDCGDPLSPARSRLGDFLRRRRQLGDMREAEKLHRQTAGQPDITQAIKTMIELLGQQIAALDRQIAGFITEDQVLAEQVRLLTAVARLGPTLFDELAELGTVCCSKIASLASFAPHAAKAEHGVIPGAYGADGERFAHLFTSPRSTHPVFIAVDGRMCVKARHLYLSLSPLPAACSSPKETWRSEDG
jgi:hypothetical protein